LPERHRFRRREALAHLLEREVGRQPVGLFQIRRFAGHVNACVFKQPVAFLQGGAFRLDAILEMAAIVERVNAHPAELGAYVELMRRGADWPNATAWLLAKISMYRVPQLTERILPFTVLVGDVVLPSA